MKNTKGITLVALVITIIMLLILAGITIAQLTGSGLFENARLAEQKSKNAQEKEDGILGDYENKIGEYIESNRDSVTISKEEYNILKNANSYSTTEKIIGTYIDGKPIYRFCYPLTWTSTDFNVTFSSMGLTDYIHFDNIIKSETHMVQNADNMVANEYYFGAKDYYGHYIAADKKSVNFRSGSEWPKLPCKVIFVIEYTKTTDTAPTAE